MIGMDRAFRIVELINAKSAEEIAYIRGKHAGLDRGRKQAVVVFIIAIVLMKLFEAL
jgi:hypothetical protein